MSTTMKTNIYTTTIYNGNTYTDSKVFVVYFGSNPLITVHKNIMHGIKYRNDIGKMNSKILPLLCFDSVHELQPFVLHMNRETDLEVAYGAQYRFAVFVIDEVKAFFKLTPCTHGAHCHNINCLCAHPDDPEYEAALERVKSIPCRHETKTGSCTNQDCPYLHRSGINKNSDAERA